MQQPENLPPAGTATGEALNREVLTIESTPPPLNCALRSGLTWWLLVGLPQYVRRATCSPPTS